MERLIAEYPDSRAPRRGAVPARRSTSSRGGSADRPRRATRRSPSDGRRLRVLRARLVQARLDLLQAGSPRRGAATSTSRFSITRSRPATTSTTRRTRTKSAGSRTRIASSASASRTSAVRERRREVLRGERRAQLRGSHLQPAGGVLLREAPLPGRRGDLRRVRRAPPAAPVFAALQHARGRDLRGGRLPEARARVEEGVRRELRSAVRVLAPLRRAARRRRSVSYLKANLQDLASHYHALYQNAEQHGREAGELRRGARWYRAYLASFPAATRARRRSTTGSPTCCSSTRTSARRRASTSTPPTTIPSTSRPRPRATPRSTRTARARSRRRGDAADARQARGGRRARCASSERFPAHEHAAAMLGAAVDDLYEMKEFARGDRHRAQADRRLSGGGRRDPALRVGGRRERLARHRRLPAGRAGLRARARADTGRRRVAPGRGRQPGGRDLQAGRAGERRRATTSAPPPITSCASRRPRPTSKIRPLAEYDAGAALIKLQDWTGAADVLESFRKAHPEHELQRDATKQMAFVYKQEGNPTRAAEEYERVAAEAKEPEARREALLVAGELYENAKATDRALAVYLAYVSRVRRARRDRRRDALQDRRHPEGEGRRRGLPRAAARDREDRRGRGRRAQRAHPLPRRAVGAGADGGLLPPLRRGEAGPAAASRT